MFSSVVIEKLNQEQALLVSKGEKPAIITD